LFIGSVQSELPDNKKLSVQEIIHLNNIRKEDTSFTQDKNVINKLISRDLIEKRGKTSGTYYVLSKTYYEFSDEKGKYSRTDWDENQAFLVILQHLNKFERAKMKDFVDLLQGRLSRKQIRNTVKKLVENKELNIHGTGRGTYYVIGENYKKNMGLMSRALDLGIKQLEDNGEL